LVAPTGAPVADQHPRDDLLVGYRAEAAAVGGARRVGEVRGQPPAAVHPVGDALDQLEVRALGVPGEDDLAGADPPGPDGEQPVAIVQRGQHRVLRDLDAK
jgi:hypothetical protein